MIGRCTSAPLGALSLLFVLTLTSLGQNSGVCGVCGGGHLNHLQPVVLAPTPGAPQPQAAAGGFSINLSFGGGLTSSQEAVFTQAKQLWESHITGYQAGISLTGIDVTAEGISIDGVGGTLGSAGPTFASIQGGYLLATQGVMSFDSADLGSMEADGTLLNVIAHELGHVLGFGTLWDGPGLGAAGTQQVSLPGTGEYTGSSALAMWQLEFGQSGDLFVPVETGGGSGTEDAHWNEPNGAGGLTGITDSQGRDLANELMTGWLGPNESQTWLSQTSINSFNDIGFTVSVLTPEPGIFVSLLAGLSVLLAVRRRQ